MKEQIHNLNPGTPVTAGSLPNPQPEQWIVPAALRELWDAGQSDIVIELVQLFLTDTAERLSHLQEAFARGDTDQLRRMAHSIKGSSSQMGEDQMAVLGRQLEEKAKPESLEEGGLVLQELIRQFEISSQAIRIFLEKHT